MLVYQTKSYNFFKEKIPPRKDKYIAGTIAYIPQVESCIIRKKDSNRDLYPRFSYHNHRGKIFKNTSHEKNKYCVEITGVCILQNLQTMSTLHLNVKTIENINITRRGYVRLITQPAFGLGLLKSTNLHLSSEQRDDFENFKREHADHLYSIWIDSDLSYAMLAKHRDVIVEQISFNDIYDGMIIQL